MSVDYEAFDHPYLSLAGETRCRVCLQEDHEEKSLTDQTDDGVDWGEQTPPEAATWSPENYDEQVLPPVPKMIYPEYAPLPEAPISINFKITGEPMITVRAHDAQSVTAILNDLEAGGVWANVAAAQASLRSQGQLGAGLGPMSPVGPPAPAPAPYAGPLQAPPPFGANVSVPSAPGYVGPQSYQSPPPPTGNWGGGGGGGYNQQDSKPEPAPQPPGWMRVNARSGPGFDNWKILREQQKDYLKGKIKWGGKSDYWIEPSLAQWLAQQGFAVTP